MPNLPHLKRSAAAAAIAACFPGLVFAAGVARVDFATGNVTAQGADGRSRTLSRGSEIAVGDTVATQQGRAQLRFVDGAQMSLQPGTEFKIEEFNYSGKADPKDSVVMNLVKGGMRTITGLIGRANRQNYRLRTEVATIGIRGTEYTVRYTNSIEVFCVDGQIFVQNDGGTLNLNGGQGAFVSNFQVPPKKSDEPPVLPPQPGKGNKDEEKGDNVTDPTNPTQDVARCGTGNTTDAQCASEPPSAPEEITSPTVPPILTGTLTGNWAAALHGDAAATLAATNDTITLNPAGALTAFGTATVGSATPSSFGNDAIVAWGRWEGAGGITGGSGTFSGRDLTNGPLHYVVGLPVTNMPASGMGTYNLMGHSASCAGAGCTSVTVNSGSNLIVNFGTGTLTVNMNFTLAGGGPPGTYTGSSCASLISGSFSFPCMSLTGACIGQLRGAGFLAGDGAVRAGMAWAGNVFGGGANFHGVNVYTK